jgi:hypothetical protein
MKRQRPQEDALDYAENGRVRANAQSQSKNGHCREAWALPELPERVSKILQD